MAQKKLSYTKKDRINTLFWCNVTTYLKTMLYLLQNAAMICLIGHLC